MVFTMFPMSILNPMPGNSLVNLKKPGRLREQKYDDKVVQFVKETVKLDEKEVSMEEFRKLFEK